MASLAFLMLLGGERTVSAGIVRFQDDLSFFVNPHMGFAYATDPKKYLTLERLDRPENPPREFQVVKLSIAWADIEKKPDVYDWKNTDEAIRFLKAKGHDINARLYLCNGKNVVGLPDWLWEAPFHIGRTNISNNAKGIAATEHPYYWEEAFQDRALSFLKAFVARYRSSDLTCVDCRIYGHCGEWDAGNNPFPWEAFPQKDKTKVLENLVGIYTKAFQGSEMPVAINAVGWEYEEAHPKAPYKRASFDDFLSRLALKNAFEAGFGIRIDTIRGWPGYRHIRTLQETLLAYGDRNFAIGETGNGYVPDTDPPMNVVIHALTAKLSSLNYGGYRSTGLQFVTNYPKAFQLGLKYLGYRFVPSVVQLPEKLKTGNPWALPITWENHGVSKLLRDHYALRVYLKNNSGAVIWAANERQSFAPHTMVSGKTFDAENPDSWWVGSTPYPARHELPAMPSSITPGSYSLYFAVVDTHTESQTPAIRLPIPGEDGLLRYLAGQVEIE